MKNIGGVGRGGNNHPNDNLKIMAHCLKSKSSGGGGGLGGGEAAAALIVTNK